MSDGFLVAGRVRSGDREGQVWVGVQGDEMAYERLESGLTSQVIHALVIGDEAACLRLMGVLVDTLRLDENTSDLLDGIERMLDTEGRSQA